MKRFLCLIFVLMLLPCASIGEESYLTIQQMKAQLPRRLTQTYETKWRQIAIDAEIILPDVDALPVALIAGGAQEPVQTAKETGWDRIEYRGPYNLLLVNEVPDYPKSVNGVRIGTPVSKGNWYSGFAAENRYVPMDEITFGEIVSKAKEKIRQFGYDPEMFEIDNPVRVWAHHVYGSGTQTDLLPGYLYMEVRPKVAGIPVMSHILQAVESHHGSSRSDEFCLMPYADIAYDGYLGDLSHIYLTPLTVVETLAEDIPLCPFDRVLAAVEQEISAGHIRKIYEIELGYVLYNQPGVYRTTGTTIGGSRKETEAYQAYQNARYYVKPVWQVNCLYVESATGQLRDGTGYTDDERNTIDYYQLLIDAQTGEMIRRSNQRDRCEFTGFLGWEEVR